MNGKRGKATSRIPGGFPDNGSTALFMVHVREMLKRLEAGDVKVADGARKALEALLLREFAPTLLRIARAKKDKTSKQWAGRLLASIGCSIQKHDKKLSNANQAYRLEKRKFGKLRVDVLFPKGIAIVVQRELKKAECPRGLLLMIQQTAGRHWKEVAERLCIPESYWPTIELREFSVKSEPKWWKFLWPLIKKNNPDFLQKLRAAKFPTRGIRYQARWASYRKEFRNHLRTLARYRDGGVL